MEIKINKENIMPDLGEYTKILISAFITVYVFKPIILNFVPSINDVSGPIALIIWVVAIVYFKNLIDIKYKGRDWF